MNDKILKVTVGVTANIDPTEFTLMVSEDEYKFLVRLEEESRKASHGLCDSHMFIKKVALPIKRG